jgi:hypothetical protein
VTRRQGPISDAIATWRLRLGEAVGDDAFEAAWQSAWAWITDSMNVSAIDALLDSVDGASWAGVLAPFQRRFLAIREAREAERMSSADWGSGTAASGRVRSDFGRSAYDRVPEVLRLVNFEACRRFVMVGCGAFPAAALVVRDATAVPEIVALDVDGRAAATARRLIEMMGERRIRVDCVDGAVHDFAGAHVVYLANQVHRKARVLERVHETAPAGATVIVREPYGVGRLVAESVGQSLPPPFRVAVVGENNPAFYSRHVLLARAT